MASLALWLTQAGPTSFPELTWQMVLWLLGGLSFVLSLLGAAAVMVYKRDWEILKLWREAQDKRMDHIERWQEDHEP